MTLQGMVTLIGPIELYVTGIKMKSRDQQFNTSICAKSSNQGTFQRGIQAAHRKRL